MEQADEQLIQAFQSGNKNALEILYARYKARILNFSFRMLNSRSDAEDVTANVFLALFSGKYRPGHQAKFSTWLFTIARNRCLDVIRSRKRETVTDHWEREGGAKNARENLTESEHEMKIREAIQQLPDGQREAIILRAYHSLSYNEIAKVLGCSVDNVKVLIFRARQSLRQELASFLKEEQS